LLCPILLQRDRRGLVGVRKGFCGSNQKVRKQPEGVKARKQRRECTVQSVLQSQKAGVDLEIPSTPKAKFVVMLFANKFSKRLQLADLGIAALDFGAQQRSKLAHLALLFRNESFPLLGQSSV
jgi:hypothetical protein